MKFNQEIDMIEYAGHAIKHRHLDILKIYRSY